MASEPFPPGPVPPEPQSQPSPPADHVAPAPPAGWPGSPPDPTATVEVRGLVKWFGPTLAVDQLYLRVPRGSFYGLVGPNGAGKTTTLRMVTGLLRPDDGEVLVDGRSVWADPPAVKQVIGVLPEDLRMFDRLRGAELLTYTGLLRGIPADVVDERVRQLLDVLDLTEAAQVFAVDYSHGMRKKLALAAALLHGPRVLFLDEPFEAIDPVSARTIRTVLQRFTGRGGTVVLSSHVMALVEQLCDHVAIVARGRVVADGPIAEVAAGASLEDRFVSLVGGREVAEEALGWLDSSSG